MDTFWTIIISVLSAILAGVFASFIKPLVDWNLEKKRAKIESRRKLIDEARIYISDKWENIFIFKTTHIYMRLAEHFSKEVYNIINMESHKYHELVKDYSYEINTETGYYASCDGYSELDANHKHMIMVEINALSKRWELE
jgi:hypothetical protein